MANADTTTTTTDDLSAAPAEQEETVLSQHAISQLKNKLRAEAEREVIANHRDEYHEVAARKFGEHGLEFTRRLTDEERAEQEMERLLEAHPGLAAKLAGKATS